MLFVILGRWRRILEKSHMSLKSFRITNNKAVQLAECVDVPRVMIISGPNGVGKSTLLSALRNSSDAVVVEGVTKILYQGPHRASRRTQVRRASLGGGLYSLLEALAQTDVASLEGLNIPNRSRSADHVDEFGSTIKHGLGKIENQRQTATTSFVDAQRANGATSISTEALVDVYAPIRTFTEYLLPHLKFDRIDFSNEDSIRCVWKRNDKGGEVELDIDDFSSGEKSIMTLFLPLLEANIHELLSKYASGIQTPVSPKQDRVFIVDEPELHLHPELQARILSYLREVAQAGGTQFILATHSPTILDQAFDDELYFLRMRDDVGSNQLIKVASNIEKLEALKELAGTAFNITTGRSIICIEGAKFSKDRPTDHQLLQLLYPKSSAYTLVPIGGKGEVINTVHKLREELAHTSFGIQVFGIVDADQSDIDSTKGVHKLPVCMIENLLLVPDAISQYLASLGISKSAEDIDAELRSVAQSRRSEEVRLRTQRQFKTATLRPSGSSVEEIKNSYAQFTIKHGTPPTEAEIGQVIERASQAVDDIISEQKELLYFSGKEILKMLFAKYAAHIQVDYKTFCYELAKVIAGNGYVDGLLNPLFTSLR